MNRNIDLTVNRLHGAYCLRRRDASAAELFYGDAPYTEDLRPLGVFSGTEMWVEAPEENLRPYFALRGERGLRWAADTAVEIAAVENFRDLGGYRTAGGRTVKWGRFFRCGAIAGMDEGEALIYRRMGIRSIFDYRAPEEAEKAPDVYGPNTAYHHLPAIAPAGEGRHEMADMDMASRLAGIQTAADADAMMEMFMTLYERLPFGNDAYRAMFAALDDENALPMAQHCSAGKDRTGVGCALLLLALGVEERTVMEDYLLSAFFRRTANRRLAAALSEKGLGEHALSLVDRMMTVTPDMLGRAFAAIRAKYPSHDAFLLEEYDLTPARRRRFLQMHTVER